MPVTRYHALNGELVGETTSGSSTSYLTDALGSVTSTVTPIGSVVNTYAFQPGGSTLAKTGSGSDPRFLWVGSHGYRTTSRVRSESYVRARHYGQGEGRWSSVDPLWPRESAYGYADGSPASNPDASGLTITLVRTSVQMNGKTGIDCSGGYDIGWMLKINYSGEKPYANGYIIQHVVMQLTGSDCDGTPLDGGCPNFYEAFPLDENGQPVRNPFDEWQFSGASCTHADLASVGDLMIVKSLPNLPPADCDPPGQPNWLSFPGFKAMPGGHASISAQWANCCASSASCSCADSSCKPGPCFKAQISCFPSCPF